MKGEKMKAKDRLLRFQIHADILIPAWAGCEIVRILCKACDQKGKLEGKIKYALGEPESFEGVFKK